MRLARLIGPALASLCLLSFSVPTSAQDAADTADTEDTARARALFSEGVELAAAGQFEEAASRFRAAYELRAAPPVAYNLAAALSQTGDLLEASELARGVTTSDESDEALRERAQALQEAVDARISRLTVRVDGDRQGVALTVDARELTEGELGVPIPMDPGTHVVEATRDQNTLERREVTLAESEAAEVALSAAAWTVVVDPEPEPEPETSGPSIFGRWWFWAIVGVVVVTGVTIGIVAAASGDAEPFGGNTNPGTITF